jgi:uncharacterized Zn finger protein (UPF0148 family)
MSDKMTPEERRNYNKAEFKRKFGQWWLIYAALAFTAILSFTSGVLLPFRPTDGGQMVVTLGGIFAAVYYSLGFLATGEGAFYFWFDKLTDHDKDNTTQLIIAWAMMITSISTSLITALAAAGFIAYWLGVFEAFYVMPLWGQKWVVWAIPLFIVAHLVTGTIFKAVSDEAEYERDAKADIRRAKNTIAKEKNEAKANYWKNNAADLARQLGELEAQEEIANYSRRVQQQRDRVSTKPQERPQAPQRTPTASYAKDDELPTLDGRPNEKGGK